MPQFPPYIFGVHDPGAEGLLLGGGKPGWIVFTVKASDGGGDYTAYSSQGHGIIVRLNYGYHPDGTIPPSSQYDSFAQQCAAFVAGSHGAGIWIIGNETNLAGERPGGEGGEVITPDLYAQCFAKCRAKILAVPGHANDLVAPAPPGPWNPQTTYPGNPNGDWIKYYQDILNRLVQMGAPPGALALHTYSHGTDAGLIASEDRMDGFPNYHKHFRAYRDFLGAVHPLLRVLPVFITETQPADPDWWQNRPTGWIQAAYAEINAWNAVPANQPIQGVCLFRWQTGDNRWSISDKPAVQSDFRAALQNDFRVRMPAVPAPQPQPPVPQPPQPQPQPPTPPPQPSASGWCPFATRRPITTNNYDVGRSGQKVKAVVLHIAAGPMSAVFPTFNNPAGLTSAHFCVGKDGSIEQYVSINDTAYGNGLKYSNGQWFNARGVVVKPTWQDLVPPLNPNLYTVSIEHDGQPEDKWTPEMIEANTRLLKWIAAQCNLTYVPHRTLVGHFEINSVDRPNCPGPNVDYERICQDANAPDISPEEVQAVQAAAERVHQLPINVASALFRFAQANQLGCAQSDEVDFQVGSDAYVAQVYTHGTVYAKKGDWGNVGCTGKPDGSAAPTDAVGTAALAATRQVSLLPINTDSALFKFAQSNQLGCPQSDEFQFNAGNTGYIGQVYVSALVYAPKNDLSNVRSTAKPAMAVVAPPPAPPAAPEPAVVTPPPAPAPPPAQPDQAPSDDASRQASGWWARFKKFLSG